MVCRLSLLSTFTLIVGYVIDDDDLSALPPGAEDEVFVPPAGLPDIGLFAWLLTFTILTRGLMTLYFVP